MLKKVSILIFCLFVAGCGSPSVSLVSTVTLEPTETRTPIPTITPEPTYTPTLPPTATPLPTPFGGGTGVIVFTANHYSEQFASDEDGIYTIYSDATGLEQVLSRLQLESMSGEEFEYIDFLTNSGKGYISTDALYSITNNWEFASKMDLPKYLFTLDFSSDGEHIFYYQTDGYLYASSFDGQEINKLLGGYEYFTGTSADGSIVYFYSGQDVYQKAVNVDGSDKRNVALASLKEYVPYEDIETPLSSARSVYTPIFDSYAVSPNNQQVAFSWGDLLFVTSASDSEFEDVKLIARLPGSDTEAEIHVDALRWSTDQNGLALLITRSNWSRSHFGSEIVYVNLEDGKINSVVSSDSSNYSLCGFSPDSTVFAVNYYDADSKLDAIQLIQVGEWSPVTLVELARWVSCPIWLSTIE